MKLKLQALILVLLAAPAHAISLVPEKIAPATKKGGENVVCHPGTSAAAKSIPTMLWTEATSGVARPPSNR